MWSTSCWFAWLRFRPMCCSGDDFGKAVRHRVGHVARASAGSRVRLASRTAAVAATAKAGSRAAAPCAGRRWATFVQGPSGELAHPTGSSAGSPPPRAVPRSNGASGSSLPITSILPGVTVDIDPARLGLQHDLRPTGRVAQAIPLTRARRHSAKPPQGPGILVSIRPWQSEKDSEMKATAVVMNSGAYHTVPAELARSLVCAARRTSRRRSATASCGCAQLCSCPERMCGPIRLSIGRCWPGRGPMRRTAARASWARTSCVSSPTPRHGERGLSDALLHGDVPGDLRGQELQQR